MPFGDYESFDSCVASNSGKDDPEAYCAAIKRRIEGENALSGAEQHHAQRLELEEFEEGDAVAWNWQGETVHGIVEEVNEDSATVSGQQITGDEGEPVYVINEYDDAAGGFRSSNVAKPESSLNESQRDLPDMTDENMLSDAELDDPCWENYTMVGLKPNGNPRCVPDDEVPDANMAAAEESECPDGKVSINGTCVDVQQVTDTPPSVLNSSKILSERRLATDPIKREAEASDTVRYANLRLLTEGVWTDQKSKTPTLYPEDGIANIEAEYPAEYDGPPVNVMHDVAQDGEVHEPSHAGHIDPNSLTYQDGALMGDVILDTSVAAGEYADQNLQSALESNGQVGFGGPSVELDLDPQQHIQNSEHPRAEKEINGGYLTGLGLVMDPADKNVAFAQETRERAVAMGDSQTDKAHYVKVSLMEPDAMRDVLDEYGLDIDEMTDDEVLDMAESLHDDLMSEMDMGDYEDDDEEEEPEMSTHGDEMEEEEEEEDMEMMDEGVIDMIQEEMDDLWASVDMLKEQMMDEEEMSEALADAKQDLADADTVEEIETRLRELEEEPTDPKTLADGSDSDDSGWAEADGFVYDNPNRL
ncbi:hypothetical protein OSG_eHP8_00010 [environmental Halophage eHP-8]|nr:hypothetical protein OSG_eHP8_00010 [environmental Halophage eHP-8]AFH21927.1 hypothetical protein OSG_eHP13_00015 [environmental Halophage eHP-13]